jgi:hypothetical protein
MAVSAATRGERALPELPSSRVPELQNSRTPELKIDPVSDLTSNLSETAQILFAAGCVIGTPASVGDLAVATIDGCNYAGLFMTDGDGVNTSVHTDGRPS